MLFNPGDKVRTHDGTEYLLICYYDKDTCIVAEPNGQPIFKYEDDLALAARASYETPIVMSASTIRNFVFDTSLKALNFQNHKTNILTFFQVSSNMSKILTMALGGFLLWVLIIAAFFPHSTGLCNLNGH